ncbi:hypothetical protein G7072_03145 [Nocardioides sp. HDW12B]|uniref:hypothetical protein n=1 Tax=Nocardioides sp. HDW12B TaxID=2714939 RepID=UPI00140B431A|nr:hypothetical protein [Nocardioides sp. HDW12B]QIK65466.1 hypothetical protein G7072_03145 [Nocardioides sp. HDW12B]
MLSPLRPTGALCAAMLLVGLVGLSGCTAEGPATPPPAGPETSAEPRTSAGPESPSPTRDVDGGESSSGTAAGPPSADDRESAACRRSERRAVRGVEFPLQQTIDDVMRSPSGASSAAAARVRARAAWVERTVLGQCSRPSAAARDFVRVAGGRGRTALGSDDLDAVMSAYSTWARSVGFGSTASALSRGLHECRAVQDRASASYRTWWRRSGTGRVWWLELTFRNDLPRRLFATLSGRARVSSPGSAVLEWGASSGDHATVPRGTSRHLVRLGSNGPYVGTGPSEVLLVEEVVVSTDLPGRASWWCSLPVPERS